MGIDKASVRELLTWLARLAAGGVFMLSGGAKSVDPWGTLYKVEDYLAALGVHVWPNLELIGVFGLCALEFLIGIFFIFGCFRKSTPIMAAMVMAFMLPFSLWIAIKNPVADCGCFGDAFIISNWATFWKNVVLSMIILFLLKYNKRGKWLVTPALQWLMFLASGVFIVCVELVGYISQPLIDFRPYSIGTPLISGDVSEENTPHFIFIYEKDGKRVEFGENDEMPSEDDGWVFIDRKEVSSQSITSKNIKDKTLRIWERDGEDDVTDEVISSSGEEILVMIPEISKVSPATTWKLNSLYEWAIQHDVEMIGVVAGNENDVKAWEDWSMASYPIYTADDTQIKEVVRGNPGIVYLVDGYVEWKSTLTAINIDDFLSPETSADGKSFGPDNKDFLFKLAGLYVICVIVLIQFSFTPKLRGVFFNKKKKEERKEGSAIHDDKAHPSE